MGMNAFDSADCQTMASALDLAWEMFVKSGGLTPQNVGTAHAALARGILDVAGNGERNTRRLAISAVARFARHQEEVSAERQWRQTGSWGVQTRHQI
jgi:phosphoribosylanthranilate isomerase